MLVESLTVVCGNLQARRRDDGGAEALRRTGLRRWLSGCAWCWQHGSSFPACRTAHAAFNELDRFAVHARQPRFILFGLLLEGWQSLAKGGRLMKVPCGQKCQTCRVGAYMRDNAFTRSVRHIASMVPVREEAELLDIKPDAGWWRRPGWSLHLARAGRQRPDVHESCGDSAICIGFCALG